VHTIAAKIVARNTLLRSGSWVKNHVAALVKDDLLPVPDRFWRRREDDVFVRTDEPNAAKVYWLRHAVRARVRAGALRKHP
jgi:hypothetical protein